MKQAEVVEEAHGRAGRAGALRARRRRRSRTPTRWPTTGTATHAVRWNLVEGKMLQGHGRLLRARGRAAPATEVTYRLAVDLSIPMIGMLRRKAEKIIIDTALKGLKKRVESLG